MEFVGEMAGGNPTEGSSVDSYLASNIHLISYEIQNFLGIKLAIIGIYSIEPRVSRFSIVSIIPAHYIDSSLEEKAEPV